MEDSIGRHKSHLSDIWSCFCSAQDITDHFTHKSEEQGELIIVGGSEHLIRTNSDLKCSDKVSYYEKTVKIEYRHEE